MTRIYGRILRSILGIWGRKALPKMQGTLSIPGLRDAVEVFWGPYGIPHVYARNERDLFLAQGYLHAQERLWQMDSTRLFLKGELAETVGDRPVPWAEISIRFRDKRLSDLDYFVRLLGLNRSARRSLEILPQSCVEILAAYCEGVNRYLETHRKHLPIEFRILRHEPKLWSPEDCVLVGKGFALLLSLSLMARLTITAMAARLRGQEEKFRSLYPTYPETEPTITRSAEEASLKVMRFLNGTFAEFGAPPAGHGSNNWVVAPARSDSDGAMLCNDPHLKMTLPATWYLIHLSAEPESEKNFPYEVWGASIPGSPCVHLGRNRRIAWGVTAALCDDLDLYREKVHPHDPNSYLVGEKWQKMECRKEIIRIRGKGETVRTFRFTRHGPVISDFTEDAHPEEVLSLKWTAREPSQELRALLGVNRARSWKEFLQALSFQTAPTLNYLYADTEGNIGYSLAGRIPIRPRPPLLPVSGWTDAHEWRGYVPFDDLPRLWNPPEGVLATANHRVADSSFPHFLSELFEPPYRIRRIRELLSENSRRSTKSMAAVQKDTVSLYAKNVIHDLKPDLESIGRRDSSLQFLAKKLVDWDGTCSADSLEALVFHELHQSLARSLLVPVLGEELTLAYLELFNLSLIPLHRILRDPRSVWFQSISRRELIENCLRDARDKISRSLGDKTENWTWGKCHTLTLEHFLGRSRLLAPAFSVGPFPSSGDGVTVNLGFYRHSNPYHHVVGPSLRMILRMGEGQDSLFVLPSGQSGHPFSPHYRDQFALWCEGKYIPLDQNRETIQTFPKLEMVAPHGPA